MGLIWIQFKVVQLLYAYRTKQWDYGWKKLYVINWYEKSISFLFYYSKNENAGKPHFSPDLGLLGPS